MSEPNLTAELHELVEEFLDKWLGQRNLLDYLHEEIDKPDKRSWLYDEFKEWIENR